MGPRLHRDTIIPVGVTFEERARWKRLATRLDLSLAQLIRVCLRRAEAEATSGTHLLVLPEPPGDEVGR